MSVRAQTRADPCGRVCKESQFAKKRRLFANLKIAVTSYSSSSRGVAGRMFAILVHSRAPAQVTVPGRQGRSRHILINKAAAAPCSPRRHKSRRARANAALLPVWTKKPGILRHLLPGFGPVVSIFTPLGQQLRLRRRIALPQFRRQCFVSGLLMSLELCQKALDDHGHHVRASEGCHVAEHVRRIQPLLANVQVQQVDQARGSAR